MLYDTTVDCPYCGECFQTLVDYAGVSEEYYEDCAVCCRPILFRVLSQAGDHTFRLDVKREDE